MGEGAGVRMVGLQAGDAEARRFAGIGPIVDDDWPVIEYFLTLQKGDPAARTDRFRSAPDSYVVN